MTDSGPGGASRVPGGRSVVRGGVVVLLLIPVLVIGAVMVGRSPDPPPAPLPSGAPPSLSTVPSPEVSEQTREGEQDQPGNVVDPDEAMQEYRQVLQSSPLHDRPAPRMTTCPEPVVTDTREQYETMVIAQVDCLHEAWQPVLAELGFSSARPAVEFFQGEGSESACGYLEAPAFYCSLDGGTLHFGDGHFEMARRWDHAVNEMVNHEYGHHLQQVAGMTLARSRLGDTVELERRSELQAVCWSAMMAAHNDAVQLDRDGRAGWQDRFESMLADERHGSQESLIRWGRRGLDAETVGECNTWIVSDQEVA